MTRRYLDAARIPRTPHTAALPVAAQLPSKIDFRAAFGQVRDQGAEGSCTGFSLAGMMQGLRGVAGLPFVAMSPRFIYTDELAKEGHSGKDVGANPADGLTIMQTVGVCPEIDDPYAVGALQPPTAQQISDAAQYRIASWSAVNRFANMGANPRAGIMPALQLLAQKVPVEIAIEVRQSFESAPGGRVPMPGTPQADPVLGGHAIVLAGYQDDPSAPGGGWAVFRNSWGTGWGDGGYGYLPYEYLYNAFLTYGLWSATLPEEVKPVVDRTHPAIVIDGKTVATGQITDGTTWAPLRPIIEAMGGKIASESTETGEIVIISPKA